VPRAPWPASGVTSGGETFRFPQQALPCRLRYYRLMRQSVFLPLPTVSLGNRSSPVAVSPGCNADLPDVYLHDSFPGCLDPYPGGPFSAFTRFFLKGIGLPHIRTGRLYHHTPHSDFRAAPYFGTAVIHFVSSLRFCSPPRSLPPQPFPAGQPWLCRPGPPRFVASPQSGPANRPNRAIDGVRTFTSPESWPCRLLP